MIADIITDKSIKPKEKTEQLCSLVEQGKISAKELLELARQSKDPVKAACIEVLEYASKKDPSVVTADVFKFVCLSLTEKAPRIKWESAKVIGNSAALHQNNLEEAIKNLLVNSEHTGTVVRWSSAFALGEIIKLKTKYNKDLIPAVESICKREEKNSIKKIYETALKKVK